MAQAPKASPDWTAGFDDGLALPIDFRPRVKVISLTKQVNDIAAARPCTPRESPRDSPGWISTILF
ncbi:MAG: hypothetical protein EXR75_11885 [Myxococcales bacterium]|nr:hypothetical protein [Myxococcales bacterium]